MPNFDNFGNQHIPSVNRKRITAAFARPANATQFAAGDVVGPITTPLMQTYANAARFNGGGGKIVEILLMTDEEVITTATFRLHFFNVIHTPAADNAAFTTIPANFAAYLGYVDPPILLTQANNGLAAIRHLAGTSTTSQMPFHYQCAAGDSGIYGVITAIGTYTPKSGALVRVTLIVEQD